MSQDRVEIWKGGRVVSSSRNLRGLLAYAHGSSIFSRYVAEIRIREEVPGEERSYGGILDVIYGDGATASEVPFASYSVMCRWVSHWRNAYGAKLTVDGADGGVVALKNAHLRVS